MSSGIVYTEFHDKITFFFFVFTYELYKCLSRLTRIVLFSIKLKIKRGKREIITEKYFDAIFFEL